MAKKNHDLVLDNHLVKQIDYTLPKLKYSVSIRKIIRWLENFEPLDVNKAIDLLYFLEFIDIPELTYRMDMHLQEALNNIPLDFNVYIYPGVATYPKSTEVINYVLKETPAYKKRNNIVITRDIKKDVKLNKKTAFILVDDFIGSGKSFQKGYDTKTKLKRWMDSKKRIQQRYLITAICMSEGKSYIQSLYPEIQIYSTYRDKLFDPNSSLFKVSNNIAEMKRFSYKYGNTISAMPYPPYDPAPYGYEASESLVAFSHTTPNNTLPLIWSDSKWYPIFPRFGKTKIQQAKELKTEVGYYLGIMNRLGIDLYKDESIIVDKKREIKYNSIIDHSLITILKLNIDGYPFPVICQILGLTVMEYEIILKYGQQRKLFTHEGKVSGIGFDFFTKLMTKVRSKRFIKKEKTLFEMKYVNYLPKSFMGKD